MKTETQASEDQYGSLARQMSKWMEHVMGSGYRNYRPRETWAPPVNLYEDDAHYHVVADLAGVDCQTIDLHVEDLTLVLRGQRQVPRPPEVEGVLRMHLMEIDHGMFCRTVAIPASVNVDRISANYCNGLLKIELPKKEQSGRR